MAIDKINEGLVELIHGLENQERRPCCSREISRLLYYITAGHPGGPLLG